MAKKLHRVLRRITVDGALYQPNHVVNIDTQQIKGHESAFDASEQAVTYALSQNGNKTKEHPVAPPEKKKTPPPPAKKEPVQGATGDNEGGTSGEDEGDGQGGGEGDGQANQK